MSATKNECNQGSPSIYRPEANAWISKRSSDLDYKGVFWFSTVLVLRSSFLQSSFSSHDENICSVDTFECLAPDRFLWSERSKIKFQDVFSSSSIKEKIDRLNMITGQGDDDVDSLIQAVTDVIVSAGDMTLPRKTFKFKKKKTHKLHKKWYDKDCHSLLRELKAAKNAFNRNTDNAYLRSIFFSKNLKIIKD